MSRKYTLDEYKEQIKDRGMTCIANKYLGANTAILHQCKKDHGHEWKARPGHIRRNQGCPYCAGNVMLTLDEYKEQIKDKDIICIANKYLGTHVPIPHQCKKDPSHEWEATPSGAKQNVGCPYCAKNIRLTLDEYKEQIKDKNIICIANKYLGNGVPVLHQCKTDPSHEWLIRPDDVKQDYGCPYCAGNVMLTLDEYKEQIKDNDIICIANKYLGTHVPIPHQCKKDPSHEWVVRPHSIKQGSGCPYCNNLKQEPRCRTWFEDHFQKPFPKSYPKWLRNKCLMELDGYCKELQLAFEYNGEQHYKYHKNFHRTVERFESQLRRDALKAKLCAEHGVTLVVVPCWERNVEAFLNDYFASTYMAL